jgi:hypothetical protein
VGVVMTGLPLPTWALAARLNQAKPPTKTRTSKQTRARVDICSGCSNFHYEVARMIHYTPVRSNNPNGLYDEGNHDGHL